MKKFIHFKVILFLVVLQTSVLSRSLAAEQNDGGDTYRITTLRNERPIGRHENNPRRLFTPYNLIYPGLGDTLNSLILTPQNNQVKVLPGWEWVLNPSYRRFVRNTDDETSSAEMTTAPSVAPTTAGTPPLQILNPAAALLRLSGATTPAGTNSALATGQLNKLLLSLPSQLNQSVDRLEAYLALLRTLARQLHTTKMSLINNFSANSLGRRNLN